MVLIFKFLLVDKIIVVIFDEIGIDIFMFECFVNIYKLV